MRHNIWLTPGGANLVLLMIVSLVLAGSFFLVPVWGFGFNAVVNQVVMLGVALLLALFNRWPLARIYRLRWSGFAPVVLGFLCGIAVWWANASIYVSIQRFLNHYLGPLPAMGMPSVGLLDGLFLLATILVLAPLLEEILFRGYFLRAYESRYRRGAWLWVALLFGLIHFGNGIADFFTATSMGLVFGYLAWKTDSLWPAVAAHAGLNLTAVVGGLVLQDAIVSRQFPWLLLVVSLVALLIALVMLRHFRNRAVPVLEAVDTGALPLGRGLDKRFWRVCILGLTVLLLLVPVTLEAGIRAGILELEAPGDMLVAEHFNISVGEMGEELVLAEFSIDNQQMTGNLNFQLDFAFASESIDATLMLAGPGGRTALGEPWVGLELSMNGTRTATITESGDWQLLLVGEASALNIEGNMIIKR
ncbi:MAG: CPBP family intramembrane metalloprotease [Firmicutes bacterium]|nr:CPBP family intramembrane metalloprotease [Bacillota bacterium]